MIEQARADGLPAVDVRSSRPDDPPGTFARAPAITFHWVEMIFKINAENAVRFKAALAGAYPDAATEVHIRVHPALIILVLDVTGASRMHALTGSFANSALHDRACSQ